MKKLLILALAAGLTFSMTGCNPVDNPDNPDPVNPDNPDKPDTPSTDSRLQGLSTDRYDEGTIAFATGTNMSLDATSGFSRNVVRFEGPADVTAEVIYPKGNSDYWVNVIVSKADAKYVYISISSNSGKAREADVLFSSGSYRKALHISQRASGDEPAAPREAYFDKNYWSRTDREKMGFYGPVKYYMDDTFSNTSAFSDHEYHFDRAGHITKHIIPMSDDKAVVEYELDGQGRRKYSKMTYQNSGFVAEEEYWEYNNPGKLSLDPWLVSLSVFTPELSHYKNVRHDTDNNYVEEYFWTFNADNTLTYKETHTWLNLAGQVLSTETGLKYDPIPVDAQGVPASWCQNGFESGNLSLHANGMLKSLGANTRMPAEEKKWVFSDYDGRMLLTHYEDIHHNKDDVYQEWTYNKHMDIAELEYTQKNYNFDHFKVQYTGYVYDKYGNFTHREISDTRWGSHYSYVWGVDVTDRLIEYYE